MVAPFGFSLGILKCGSLTLGHLIGSLEYHKVSLSIIKISLRVSVGAFEYHWDPVSYLGTILILIVYYFH